MTSQPAFVSCYCCKSEEGSATMVVTVKPIKQKIYDLQLKKDKQKSHTVNNQMHIIKVIGRLSGTFCQGVFLFEWLPQAIHFITKPPQDTICLNFIQYTVICYYNSNNVFVYHML